MKNKLALALLILIVAVIAAFTANRLRVERPLAERIDYKKGWQQVPYTYERVRSRGTGMAQLYLDSGRKDTSDWIAIRPGSRLAFISKAWHTDNEMDFELELQISFIDSLSGHNWYTLENISITDTLVAYALCNSGNPILARYARYIIDPIDAQYVPSDSIPLGLLLIGTPAE